MGYYLTINKKCTKSTSKFKTKLSTAIEKCDKESLCKGILVPKCDLNKDSMEICKEYEEDKSLNQTSCFWMKSKLMC